MTRRLISSPSRNMIELKRRASLSGARKFRRRFIRRMREFSNDRANGEPREKGTANAAAKIFISTIRRVSAPRERNSANHRSAAFAEPTKSNGGVINIKNAGDGKTVRWAG